MNLKEAAIEVVNTINANGYLALFAGGCVRDMLLEREPKDYDVATNAAPEIVSGMFNRTIEVGAQFGVIMVMVGDVQVEVATFRSESGYVDGRRPDNIEFTDAKEDALRRDFTINGMFYDPSNSRVIDYVDGRVDLTKRCIRTIGSPELRFGEDYLRMLRAVRFSAQLDFEIEEGTWKQLQKQSYKITQISGERIASELENICLSMNPSKGFSLFVDSGLAAAIFSGMSDSDFSVGTEMVSRMSDRIDLSLGLAAFLSNVPLKKAIELIEPLKLSRKIYAEIRWIYENRGALVRDDLSLGELKVLLSNENYKNLYSFELAYYADDVQNIEALLSVAKRAKSLAGCDLTPDPLINGHDIMALGVKKGPAIGKIFNELYMLQLEEQITTKEQAIEWVALKLKEAL